MSWFRLTAVLLSPALLVGVLAGCGFRPLYAPSEAGVGAQGFTTVYVAQVPDRLGQQFRNSLVDMINPKGDPDNPTYVLRATLSESREELAVQKSASASRANVNITVSFTLTKSDGSPVMSGASTSVASYNILDFEYATLKALENVRARAVRQLAENVRVRLGVYFHRSHEVPATPR